MKTTCITSFAGATVVMLAASAGAVQMSGSVGFGGGIGLDGGISVANAITSFVGVRTEGSSTFSGDYVGIPDGVATAMTPFAFDPFGGPVTPQWSFTYSGTTYEFDLTSVVVTFQNVNNLVLDGTGVARAYGALNFEDSPGTWNLTISRSGTALTFATTADVVIVTDGDSTVAMLGLGMVLMGWTAFRKR